MKQIEKIIPFPSYMKEKLEFIKNSSLEIIYENGKLITIPKTNIEIIIPHIIIFKTDECELKLIYYGDYDENRNRFYTIDLKEEISLTKLREIIDKLL